MKNLIEECFEAMKQQDKAKLEINLKIEDATLYDVFTLINEVRGASVYNLPQNERVYCILELSGIVQVLELKNIDIAYIKRKILNYITKFYTLNILSKDIKVDKFVLSLDYDIPLFND